MPSLKAIRNRIVSVKNTRKITRAIWPMIAAPLAVVAIAGIAYAVGQTAASEIGPTCQPAPPPAWNGARKAAIAAAFRTTGKPFADDAFRGVSAKLDSFVEQLAATRLDACQATHMRGEQSEAVLDLRMQCLDRRAIELTSLVESFDHPDGRIVERAISAAQELSPPAQCTALRAARGEPVAAIDRPIVEAVSRAAALRAAGHLDEAEQVARGALASARGRQATGLEAEALAVLGEAALSRHDGPAAERSLFDALEAAERAHADDVEVRVAIALARAVGDLQDRTDEADKWFRLAAAMSDRIGVDDQWHARLALGRAGVFSHAGKYREALAEARRAFAELSARTPSNPLAIADALNAIARALLPLGEESEAQAKFQAAFDLYVRAVGPAHPSVGIALANLGIVADDQGRYEEARGFFERALAVTERLDPRAPMVVSLLSDLGMELDNLARYGEAQDVLTRALKLASELPASAPLVVAGIHDRIGELARRQHRLDDAIRELKTAIEIGNASVGADNPQVQGSSFLLGRAYLDQGKLALARPPLERALRLSPNELDRADIGMALGRVLWETDRARARELVSKARQIYRDHAARAVDVRDLELWFELHAPDLP